MEGDRAYRQRLLNLLGHGTFFPRSIFCDQCFWRMTIGKPRNQAVKDTKVVKSWASLVGGSLSKLMLKQRPNKYNEKKETTTSLRYGQSSEQAVSNIYWT